MTELQNITRYTVVDSPIDGLLLTAAAGALTGLHFSPCSVSREWVRDDDEPVLAAARRELGEYFAGTLHAFTVPVSLDGSPWEQRVWQELQRIPYGETRSYGAVATAIGAPLTSSRAVGTANGRNPVAVIVPCHRVIGADGSLTGFGGGLERKRLLLDLEAGRTALAV
jgi:methylated-DNA-[protein]-cysteine S-methyltransferase